VTALALSVRFDFQIKEIAPEISIGEGVDYAGSQNQCFEHDIRGI
jgi:hypothetical protein